MTSTFFINHQTAVILFDNGASHYFISAKFGAKAGLDFCHTKGSHIISTPGRKIGSNQIIRGVPLKLASKIFPTNLILLALEGMDVTLRMEWMNTHGAILDISSQAIELNSPIFGNSVLYLPHQECINSCAFAMKDVSIEDIPVVCEYTDVFSNNLPGIPPDLDIEFIIELQPGTTPISKRLYRMPHKELAEMKI